MEIKTTYFADGNIDCVTCYKDGKMEIQSRYIGNNQLYSTTFYKVSDGIERMDGKYLGYNEGILVYDIDYENNKMHGEYKTFIIPNGWVVDKYVHGVKVNNIEK